jgi:hypothetical protein
MNRPSHRSLTASLLAGLMALAGCGGASPAGKGGGTVVVPPPPTSLDSTAVSDAATLVDFAGTDQGELAVSMVLMRAGFDLMNPDGTVALPGDLPHQGVAFEQGDLPILSQAMAQGPRITLDDLLASWSAFVPAATPAALADLQGRLRGKLVDSLLVSAASTDPVRLYWSHLIVALGRQSGEPYDLLDHAVPGTASLDPMQVALLSYRYQADLWIAGQRAGKQLRLAPAGQGAPLAAVSGATPGPRPCTMNDTQQTVMDVTSLASSTFFGGLIDEVAKTIPAAETFGKFTAGANAALTVVKMIWTFIAFDGKVELDAPMLVRTKTAIAGESRTFSATFTYSTGNGQVANCIRPALNAAGIDFSLPQDGPIADAKVDWELFGTKSRVAGQLPIVRFQAGQVQLGGRTDATGLRQVGIEGGPQSVAIAANAIPDYRAVNMMAKVALKDSKLWTDLQDAVGAALAGNPASMMLSAVSETLMRMNTPLFSASRGFTVKDWTNPGNALIHVQSTENRFGTATSAGTGTETVSLDVDIYRKLPGTLKPIDIMLGTTGPGYGAATLSENYRLVLDYAGDNDRIEPCLCVIGNDTIIDRNGYHLGGSGDADALLMITVQPDGSFSMDVPIGSMAGPSKGIWATSGCGALPFYSEPAAYTQVALPTVTVTGQLDLTKASGDITGTATLATSMTVPGMVGGLYSVGGLSQLPISPVVTVDYSFSYTLTRIPYRLAPASPPLASTAPRLAVPAYTSWQPAQKLTSPQMRCAAPGGP